MEVSTINHISEATNNTMATSTTNNNMTPSMTSTVKSPLKCHWQQQEQVQTTHTIHTPTATQEKNDATAIATPSSSSSSLHAPTCVNNSGTWTFNVCSDYPSLKNPDNNMDDDNKLMTMTRTTTRIIKTTKTSPVVPEATTTTPNENSNVKNKDAQKQQPQPFFGIPAIPINGPIRNDNFSCLLASYSSTCIVEIVFATIMYNKCWQICCDTTTQGCSRTVVGGGIANIIGPNISLWVN